MTKNKIVFIPQTSKRSGKGLESEPNIKKLKLPTIAVLDDNNNGKDKKNIEVSNKLRLTEEKNNIAIDEANAKTQSISDSQKEQLAFNLIKSFTTLNSNSNLTSPKVTTPETMQVRPSVTMSM